MDEEMDFDEPLQNPWPGNRVLGFVRANFPKFHRLFSDWIREKFNEKQQNQLLEQSKKIEKLFINLSVNLDPLFLEDGLKFFQYIRVVKNLPPLVMEKYLDSMTVTSVDIDLAETSRILLDNFNLENYQRQKITNQRKPDLLRNFTPAQVETLLKFLPAETGTIIGLTRLERSKRDFIRKLTNSQLEFYKKFGGAKLRKIAGLESIFRRRLFNGTSRLLQNYPEISRMSWTERERFSRFVNRNRVEILNLNTEAENLIGQLHNFNPHEKVKYRQLTKEEIRFLRVISEADLARIVNFREREFSGSLKLTDDEKAILAKGQISDTMPEIFDKTSEKEIQIWRTIVSLTDEEIDKLTREDLDLIAVNPKLREPEILKRYLNSNVAEREMIFHLHTETGRGRLSPFGELVLHSYIQANLAPTIWSNNNPELLLEKFRNQPVENRMSNTKILSAAAVMKPAEIESISKQLRGVGESSLVYYLRVMQYSPRTTHWDQQFVRNIFAVNSAPRGDVFNFADQDDVDFLAGMCRDSFRYDDVNMIEFFMSNVAHSNKEHLLRIMRIGLKENQYRVAKILFAKKPVLSSWFAEILKPEERFEFLQLPDIDRGNRNLAPLLEDLNSEQLKIIFRANPIPLSRNVATLELLYDKIDNFSGLLSMEVEHFPLTTDVVQLISEIDPNLHRRIVAKFGTGCGTARRRRQLGDRCVDSYNEKTEIEELSKTIEKVADKVGLYYTIFTVGKHLVHGDVRGIGLDALNVWIMPNIGMEITARMTKAGSPLLRIGAPVVGNMFANLLAFVGVGLSIAEYGNSGDNFDRAIAGLHFLSNAVYIGGMSLGPYGMPISVAVFITSDIVENILRMEQFDEKYPLTWKERFEYLWNPGDLKRDLEAKEYYTKYIENILSSFGNNYDRIVIFLPDILVRQSEIVPKSDANILKQAWYDSFGLMCGRGNKTIVDIKFFNDIQSNFEDYFRRVPLKTRNIPDRVNGYYLTLGPVWSDVNEHPVSSSTSAVDPSDRCLLMRVDQVQEVRETVEKWGFEKNVISYERFGNSSSTLYYVPIETAKLELFHNQPIDVYFEGSDINITGHGEPTTNIFHFTNDLIRCNVDTRGTNYFVMIKNNFTCNLNGGYNVGVVRDDFEDARNLSEIFGSENRERLKISHAGYVDGRGGNDTIIGNNYTIVRSYWGDWIVGKTVTILPFNVSEIDKIVYDRGFIVYNENNQSVAIDEKSKMKTLDSFILTPSKIDEVIHVHKFVDGEVTLKEGLKLLRGIKNEKFHIVKQLSSANYEIMLGDFDPNVFYPEREFVNFYWEGTKDLYVFPRINANITISRANGILNFQLLPNAYNETVVRRKKNNDLVIIHENLRIRLLNDYRNITFAMNDDKYYKLTDLKFERDYCTHVLEITGNGMIDTKDYNCFDFKSKEIMFFEVRENLLLTTRNSSLLVGNYTDDFDYAVRFNGEIFITPEEFRANVRKANLLNLYKIEEKIEIFHNQPINQNKIGLLDFGDKSINDIREVIRGKDLDIEYKNECLVLLRNWTSLPEARKMIFLFQDCKIDNEECILNDNCESRGILSDLRCDRVDSNELLTRQSDSTTFEPEICKDNVAVFCLLAQRYLNKKCPPPKFRRYERNVCAEAFWILERMKRELKKSGRCVGEEECYSLYERIVGDLKNESYSGSEDISKADVCGEVFFAKLKNSVRRISKILFDF